MGRSGGISMRAEDIQHLTGEALARFEFPLPPLPEQRRIVGILDEAFDGIATAKANAEKNLQNARALFESHLQAVFTQRGKGGWRSRLEVGEHIRPLRLPRARRPIDSATGIATNRPILRMNIQSTREGFRPARDLTTAG